METGQWRGRQRETDEVDEKDVVEVKRSGEERVED